MKKFIIVGDGHILKSCDTFKQAMKDVDFFSLMYTNVYIYMQVINNGDPTK